MSSSPRASIKQRRWLVVGIALQNVLTPCLRDKIKNEMMPFYQHVVRNFGLDKQKYPAILKTIPPSSLELNYGSINNNAGQKACKFDYCVKDEVSLGKLFMKPYMAHFNAFDSSFDASAALAVLCGAQPFTAVKAFAEDVRSKVRNEWAHCDFAAWTEALYDNCFDLMETLVINLRFAPADEAKILDELKLWRKQGLEICLGKPLDGTLLRLVRNEVQTLFESLGDYRREADEKIKKICETLDLFKFEFDKAIVTLEQTCDEINRRQEKMEKRQEQVETTCKTLEENLDELRTAMHDVSSPVDSKPILFDVPDQNRWFTGREKELEILERCLPFESNKELKISAICGLGGCGKTTLATQFSWKRKLEYEGGVFWISLEDDKKFRNSVNDLALSLRLMKEDSEAFELTLSEVLNYISQQRKPWLMVTDNVDQLTLSDEMHKVLSGRWKRQATGHLLLTTRREPKEVCGCIDLELSCCIELSSFSVDDAKSFLVTRIGFDNATKQEVILNELVGELGCLPLALEQAGAHIKALQCPLSAYLDDYKRQRLKLLSQCPAKPSWEYESQSRLSVHTTWLINYEYIKRSPQGELASRFVRAAAFLAPDEIEEDLINYNVLSVEDPLLQTSADNLSACQILELITKFSLFQRKSTKSLVMHRLVQEFIRNLLTTEEIVTSLHSAVGLVEWVLRGCSSTSKRFLDKEGTAQEDYRMFEGSLSSIKRHAIEIGRHARWLRDQKSANQLLSYKECIPILNRSLEVEVQVTDLLNRSLRAQARDLKLKVMNLIQPSDHNNVN